MNEEKELKLSALQALYDQAVKNHHYFLNWRYLILAGHITISGFLLGYLIDKNCEVSYCTFLLVSTIGLFMTIIFYFITRRNNELYRRSQNKAYIIEYKIAKTLNDEGKGNGGIYHELLNDKVRRQIDGALKGENDMPALDKCDYDFRLTTHTGAINTYFTISFIAYIVVCFLSLLLYLVTIKISSCGYVKVPVEEKKVQCDTAACINNNINIYNNQNCKGGSDRKRHIPRKHQVVSGCCNKIIDSKGSAKKDIMQEIRKNQ